MDKNRLSTIFLLISILIITCLALANMQSVTVSYLFGQFQLPLIVLILVSALLGSLTTFLAGITGNIKKNRQAKKDKKQSQKSAKTDQEKN